MDILVAYDISTDDKKGKKRLRKVAVICKNYGQRVQYSLFECRVNEIQYESLFADLKSIVNPEKDSLRIYRLRGNREDCIECYGRDHYTDFEGPLIL